VYITGFQIFNKPVSIGTQSSSPLQSSILNTHEIPLSYDQSVFSFEFAALDFSEPKMNKYAYKMEGVDPEWVYTSAARRFATYTQLDPGEYIFRVRGSNNDGVWNDEGSSIKIIIAPPWWRTNWAYITYIFLFALTLYALRTYDQKRQRIKHELELEHLNAEKLEELDRMKSRFFANISHEFRTPLTLIEGPIKRLLNGSFAGNLNDQYHLILRNTKRLLKLVNQLLDLTRLGAGQMALKTSLMPVIPILRGITMIFASKADLENINLEFKADKEDLQLYLDRDKLETIITNLLSNAFKYTPESGKILVTINTSDPNPMFNSQSTDTSRRRYNFVEIKICNTGQTIPADKIDKIFDRFYYSDENKYSDEGGIGIGLALTKELVELHNGWIQVTSDQDAGTVFTVAFPTGRDHLKDEQIIETPTGDTEIEVAGLDTSPVETKTYIEEQQNEKPLILIVEDNADVRQFIRSGMEDYYRLIEASDGKQGFQQAIDKIPDLIISDIMMPEMDGYEFCKKIRMDERTSHIPFIFLTAKAGSQDKMLGLETGADEYLVKPFSSEELIVRIQNIMEQRKLLRKRFIKEYRIQPAELSLSSLDKTFLNRFLKIIEKNISDPEFDVDKILQNVYMSRAVLYRKIKALTGQSVKQFIRTIRLRRAALVLSKGAASVTQTAYQVGFKNPAYFSECFQNQYGLSPSKFAHQFKKTN
jgi:signal transduction histidine kinase/DNA-binding response OmpR family regulator